MLALLLSELRPEDDVTKVMEVWSGIYYNESEPANYQKYAPLALALSLIYDNPKALPKGAEEENFPTLGLIERYDYFKMASDKGKLSLPAYRASVRDLVRMVDLNISKAEIEWTQKSVSGSAKKAGANYDAITYLMERATDGLNPYEHYTLSEIKKHGGICGDQSHYSMNTSKARGIPAITVVGTGDRGPHAWLEFMPKRNEWASHGAQGITNGKAHDSQRGRQVSSRLFRLESLKDYEPKKRESVLVHLQLAKLAIEKESYPVAEKLITAAKKIAKTNHEIWQIERDLHIASGADIVRWTSYFSQLEKIYQDYSNILDWSLRIKIKHLFAKLPEEDRMKLLEREIRSVARELGSEENALITVVDRVAAMLAKQKESDALRSLYRKSFRRYGEDLELFTKLIGSYRKNGAQLADLRPQIPGDLLKAYKRTAETNSKEYFRAKMEINVLGRIVRVYKELGTEDDQAKIAKLEKDMANRLKKVKRSAL